MRLLRAVNKLIINVEIALRLGAVAEICAVEEELECVLALPSLRFSVAGDLHWVFALDLDSCHNFILYSLSILLSVSPNIPVRFAYLAR